MIAKKLLLKFKRFQIKHVFREGNGVEYHLVKATIIQKDNFEIIVESTSNVMHILRADVSGAIKTRISIA